LTPLDAVTLNGQLTSFVQSYTACRKTGSYYPQGSLVGYLAKARVTEESKAS